MELTNVVEKKVLEEEPKYSVVIMKNKLYVVSEGVRDPFAKIASGDFEGIRLVARNRPCYCGSGKNFKNCHIKEFPLTSSVREKPIKNKRSSNVEKEESHSSEGM